MALAQINLTEREAEALEVIAKRTGRTQDEVLHHAIDEFLSRSVSVSRKECLSAGRGLWRDRDDTPTVDELRREWDRA